jgi:hypothetical protein
MITTIGGLGAGLKDLDKDHGQRLEAFFFASHPLLFFSTHFLLYSPFTLFPKRSLEIHV